jgi:hypothetical protein
MLAVPLRSYSSPGSGDIHDLVAVIGKFAVIVGKPLLVVRRSIAFNEKPQP